MIILFLFLSQMTVGAPVCDFKYNHDSSLLEWTAYKFTNRAPVKGHFKSIKVDAKPAKAVTELLKSTTFEIDATTVDAGDPARNTNVREFFFKVAVADGKMRGQVTKVTGNDEKGTLDVKFTINGKVVTQSFDYTVDKKNRFVARAESDILRFGWKDALSSLNEACKELHKGEDGESKTWSDVSLYVTTVLNTKCDVAN